MSECTVFLHCEASDWEYHCDVSLGDVSTEERMISITGEVAHQGFFDRMPFDFRFVSGLPTSGISELAETNVLEFNEAMPEYNIKRNLATHIPVSENQLDDLRECLFLLGNNQGLSLSVTLTVYGLQKDRTDNDRVVPIEGRNMRIASFAWKLSYDSNQ